MTVLPTPSPTTPSPTPPSPTTPGDAAHNSAALQNTERTNLPVSGSADQTDHLAHPEDTSRWKRRLALATFALVVAGAAAFMFLSGDDSAEIVEAEPLRAVAAEQRDLVDFTTLDGTLTFATTASVTAGSNGTITDIVTDGAPVERGDVLYELNASPVVLFYGDVPMYRVLDVGAEGDDVLVLERNLASLGHHTFEDEDGNEVDTGFTVDGIFDSATTEAVQRWQAELGLDESGTVDPNLVFVVDGPAVVSTPTVDIGARVQAGTPIMHLHPGEPTVALYAAHSGEIELIAPTGSALDSGTVVYTVDEQPVTAIVLDPDDRVSFDRDLQLGVTDGDDIEVLEQMLVDLGFDADGDLEVDDEFDAFTAEAIADWEDDLADRYDEFVADDVMDRDAMLVVEPNLVVGETTNRDSDTTASGSELSVFGGGAPARMVEASIDVADQDKLTEGTTVEVEFPDGTIVSGVVGNVATSSVTDPTALDATPQLPVEIHLEDIPASAVGFNELDVEVKIVDSLASGVTVVPASALVATGDGGHAVEVVVDGGTRTEFRAVTTGMFADSYVEVTGIEPGVNVVVPR